jgi:gluconate 2-dehydrogenase gamma chain
MLPGELRWDAERPGLRVLLSRRQFLKAAGAVAALATLPVVGAQRSWAFVHGRYFTRHEFDTLNALCDRIIPPDADAGAGALGAARYISHTLTALDRRRPRIFAGGPFSGRDPYPDNDTGTPSKVRPRNYFHRFTPLTRLQELAWRIELYGSASVPEGAALDAQFGGPKKGLRDVYRESLATVDQVSITMRGARYVELSAADQDAVFTALDQGAFAPDPRRGGKTFMDLLIGHTIEGCFAAPEYGGNRKRRGIPAGWQMLHLQGDVQPLGYSIFSNAIDDYVERPDLPMSTANPNELDSNGNVVPIPLTADGQAIQDNITLLTSAFASGVC